MDRKHYMTYNKTSNNQQLTHEIIVLIFSDVKKSFSAETQNLTTSVRVSTIQFNRPDFINNETKVQN